MLLILLWFVTYTIIERNAKVQLDVSENKVAIFPQVHVPPKLRIPALIYHL